MRMTRYYSEFLRYYKMADYQMHNCNLGNMKHKDFPFDDDLMKKVTLYDVTERKYAGFGQVLIDMYNPMFMHPYSSKPMSAEREKIIESFENTTFGFLEFIYVYFVHRLTGSGINYSLKVSGYHNSILPKFHDCNYIEDMVKVIKNHVGPMYTSSGYQIAAFKKPKDAPYKKAGDYFLCELLPDLVCNFATFLTSGGKKTFRQAMVFLEDFNRKNNMNVFYFQYAAVLADIADYYPSLIESKSKFFYGKNSIECMKYLAFPQAGLSKEEFLDGVMDRIVEDTGGKPYDLEDVTCDFIRWVENYINPKNDYSNLNLDKVFSSCKIKDHPYGRQEAMLKHGLVKTFNGKPHPSDDKIIKENNMTADEYRVVVRNTW